MEENRIYLTINFLVKPDVTHIYPEGEAEFYLVEKLRDLPGRRAVWKAHVYGTNVLLKVYNKHAKQHRDVDAEWDNAIRLMEYNLRAASPLFRCVGKNGEMALAFEYIDKGEIFTEHIKTVKNPLYILKSLFEMHAKQHNVGCYQSDNH